MNEYDLIGKTIVSADIQLLKAQLGYAIDKSFAMQDLLVKIPIRLAVDIENVLADMIQERSEKDVKNDE